MSNEHLSQKIAEVITKRQLLATKIEPVQQHLRGLSQEVSQLNRSYRQLQGSIQSSGIKANLESLDLVPLEVDIQVELDQLQKLHDRISRPTLNIGVVGLMRQGKSTLLQQLSGLSDQEIPARAGSACTAVRSTICHQDTDTYAEVMMHSEQSFLQEVIAPYFEKLSLGKAPTSLDEFAAWQPNRFNRTETLHQTMYDHLLFDYHVNLRHYRSELHSGSPRFFRIEQQVIPQFVSQERNQQGKLTTYQHLSVRQVKIFCRFRQFGVDRLGLVDVPGLGDTRLGDEEMMLQALGSEADVVLFLRRPDRADQWKQTDFKLYDIAAQALPDLANRSFMVLNHQTNAGDNHEVCQMLQQTLGKMKFVDAPISNCANSEQANQVLARVLDYLEHNIVKLEENYAQACQNRVMLLHQRLEELCQKAQHMMDAHTEEARIFRPRIQEFMENLTEGLRAMVRELAQKREETDSEFQKGVESALSQCRNSSLVPSEEVIRKRAEGTDLKNSYGATAVILMAEMRASLSKNFLTLDDGLQQTANKLKKRVAEVLVQRAGLRNLSEEQDMMFLQAMTDRLTQCNSPLSQGFQALLVFNISYGSLLLKLIRKELMVQLSEKTLWQTPDPAPAAAQSAKVNFGKTVAAVAAGVAVANGIPPMVGEKVSEAVVSHITAKPLELNDGKAVRERLQQMQVQAIAECEKILNRWLDEPSKIRYYMAAEFVEFVLDAEGMGDAWEDFLRRPEVGALIWEEVRQIEQLKQLQRQWLESVQRLQMMNQTQAVRFI
jgi:Dynamin family